MRDVLAAGIAWAVAGTVSVLGLVPQLPSADPGEWIREGGAFALLAGLLFWVMKIGERKLGRIEKRMRYLTAAIVLGFNGELADKSLDEAARAIHDRVSLGG